MSIKNEKKSISNSFQFDTPKNPRWELYYKELNGKKETGFRPEFILHRIDGPAKIFLSSENRIEYYFINGLEPKDHPSAKHYHYDTLVTEEWTINKDEECFHRVDGPARIFYNMDAKVVCEEYWLEGEEIFSDDK